MPGPIPADLDWFARELRAGRTVVIRSDKDIPPEAAAAAEYNRRAGIRSILVIPLPVGGRVVAAIGFGAFRSTREWPAEFVARVTVIGEVMAQALARTRSEAVLRASEARWQSIFASSSIGISTFDQDLRYLATNPAFRAMLGYTDEELRHLTPLDITVEGGREKARLRARRPPAGQGRSLRCCETIPSQGRNADVGSQFGGASAGSQTGNVYRNDDRHYREQARGRKLRATQTELARVTSLTAAGQMAARSRTRSTSRWHRSRWVAARVYAGSRRRRPTLTK